MDGARTGRVRGVNTSVEGVEEVIALSGIIIPIKWEKGGGNCGD